MKNAKMFLSPLTSFGKQKSWGIPAAILFLSLLFIDLVNAHVTSSQNATSIMPSAMDSSKDTAPEASRTPEILVESVNDAFTHSPKPQNLYEKFNHELINITKDFNSFTSEERCSSVNKTSTYSANEYGRFAAYLNKFKQLLELSKQEATSIMQAFNQVNLNSIFTEEVLFDFLNIIDKKKKLEQLLIYLNESEKGAENAYSEFVTWVLSSPEVDEAVRKDFINPHNKTAEERRFIKKEAYKIKKNITREFIKSLDFFSTIYGTYEKGANSQLIFSNPKDFLTWKSHCDVITNLCTEETSLLSLSQQKSIEVEKSLEAMLCQDSEKVKQQTTNTVKEMNNLYKALVTGQPSKTVPTSMHRTEEYGQAAPLLDRFEQCMDLCRQEAVMLDKAFSEIDVNSICSEEVLFNFEKITDRKKKLERMCVIIDESVKRLEKYTSDYMQWVVSESHFDDQTRKSLQEDFNRNTPILGKRLFTIQKEFVLEYIKLLNFLSIKFGTYKLINKTLFFPSEAEGQIYYSYIANINKKFKEEQEVDLLLEKRMQDILNKNVLQTNDS